MRLFSLGGLLVTIAAAVLLGIATFGVPINDSYYLVELVTGQTDFKFGPFGYTQNGHASATKLGYDAPRNLGGQNPISSFVHSLSYVLVLYPIAFALAVVAALVSFLAVTCKTWMNVLAIILVLLGAKVATAAFAIVIGIYFSVKDEVGGQYVDTRFGQSFYFTVIGAALMFLAAFLMAGGWCCDPLLSRHRRSTPTAGASYSAAPAKPNELPGSRTDLPAFPEYHPSLAENVYEMDDTRELRMVHKPPSHTEYLDAVPAMAPAPPVSADPAPYLAASPAGSSSRLLTEEPYLPSRPSESSIMPTEHAYVDAPEAPPSLAPRAVSEQQADAWFLHGGTQAPPQYPPALLGTGYLKEKH
ncbi:hypothetical protein MEQU1_000447 [Malassezia equina]|uniref:SUR7/PalI family protein n=1 Tax=Malassezia equina TaxID=1381935 RepID=A0AAF0EBX4_9BASI|nr:hypothetical protein MEQU1_000447 [Malassezia equina]